jgi:hypothetical protein
MLKNLRPIVIYSDKLLNALSILMDIGGMALFPFIILREKYRDSKEKFWVAANKKTINHESIHFQQALELGVIPFYLWYVLEWVFKLPFYGDLAYYEISFEREAYANQNNLKYLKERKRYCWINLIFKN